MLEREELVVAAALFAVHAFGLAPSVDWLDAGNLVAAAWDMGVPHPPGEPGWLVLGRLAALLPIGDIAFRVNLLSAASVAAVAVPVALVARAGVRGFGGLSGRRAIVTIGFAAGMVALGFAGRTQAVRAEVYGPTAALLLGALCAVVVSPGLRSAAVAGLLLGLAGAIHPLLAAAAAPGLIVARVVRRGARLSDLVAGVGAAAVATLTYAWLPLRAMARPALAWGVPDTPARFLDVLLARGFARNFGGADSSLVDNLGTITVVWAAAGLPVLLVLGLAAWGQRTGHVAEHGGAASRSEDPTSGPEGPVDVGDARRVGMSLLIALPVWLAGNAATILPQNKVFPTNPDLLGYLLVGALGAAPVAAIGLARLGSGLGPRWTRRRAVVPLLAAACVVALGLQLLDGARADRRGNHLAGRWGAALAVGLPPGAILVPSGNSSAFAWSWLSQVEERRPDLVLLRRVLLGHEHELLRLGGAQRLAGLGVEWAPALRERPVDALADVRVPWFVEVREAELDAARDGSIRWWGLVAGSQGGVGNVASRERDAVLSELAGPLGHWDEEARLVLGYWTDLRRDARKAGR